MLLSHADGGQGAWPRALDFYAHAIIRGPTAAVADVVPVASASSRR
jgi:hypothetical protein